MCNAEGLTKLEICKGAVRSLRSRKTAAGFILISTSFCSLRSLRLENLRYHDMRYELPYEVRDNVLAYLVFVLSEHERSVAAIHGYWLMLAVDRSFEFARRHGTTLVPKSPWRLRSKE